MKDLYGTRASYLSVSVFQNSDTKEHRRRGAPHWALGFLERRNEKGRLFLQCTLRDTVSLPLLPLLHMSLLFAYYLNIHVRFYIN